ncbi:hypothetical protein S7711_10873, partial [Stachybotrys chartarum IBT 7711]
VLYSNGHGPPPRTRLCATCRKLTLQDLHKGTPFFFLGEECDVCEMIISYLRSARGWSSSRHLPMISLVVPYEERRADSGFSGEVYQWLYDLGRKLLNLSHFARRFIRARECPFARIVGRQPGGIVAMSLKATPAATTL